MIDSSNDVVISFGDVDVSNGIEAEFMGHVQARLRGWATVAAIAFLPVARNCDQPLRCEIQPSCALIVEIAEVQRSVRTDGEAVRIVYLGIGITRDSCADQCR